MTDFDENGNIIRESSRALSTGFTFPALRKSEMVGFGDILFGWLENWAQKNRNRAFDNHAKMLQIELRIRGYEYDISLLKRSAERNIETALAGIEDELERLRLSTQQNRQQYELNKVSHEIALAAERETQRIKLLQIEEAKKPELQRIEEKILMYSKMLTDLEVDDRYNDEDRKLMRAQILAARAKDLNETPAQQDTKPPTPPPKGRATAEHIMRVCEVLVTQVRNRADLSEEKKIEEIRRLRGEFEAVARIFSEPG